MSKKIIIIIGAGLSGLSAAWHLQKKGIDCQVFEKEPEAGGLCRSKTIKGFTFDYDGHLLHFRHKQAFNFTKDLLGSNLTEHKRNAWIYSFDRYIRYPFQANLGNLPLPILKECLSGFIQAARAGNHRSNRENLRFAQWLKETLGEGIAKHFMTPYNTKFWRVAPHELTCEWLDGFIPVPSLTQVIEGAMGKNEGQLGYNARFWYPKKGGISQLVLALAAKVKNVHTDYSVAEINLKKREIRMSSGARERFDSLVSTVPLPEVAGLIKDLPKATKSLSGKLRWNSIFNLNLGINEKIASKQHWIYFPQRKFCFFRVGFPHNFSDYLVPPNKSSIYAEVSYSSNNPIDKRDVVSRIKSDLMKAGILSDSNRICAEDVNDIKYGYPVYDFNYHKAREGICRFLLNNNVYPCGRYGCWRYMSMEDCLLDGKRIADNF